MKPRTKRILNISLILATFAVVLYITLRDPDIGNAVKAVRSMTPGWIAASVGCFAMYLLMDALSVLFFLRRQGFRVPLRYMLFVSVSGQYYSNITPGASGGQPMQIYYLHRRGVPGGIATSALVMRFFCFQFMLEAFATVLWIAYGPFVAEQVGGNMWILIVGYVYNTVIVGGVIVLCLCRPLVRFLVRLVIRIGVKLHLVKDAEGTLASAGRTVDAFHDSLALLFSHPLELCVQLLLGGLQLLSLMTVIVCVYHGIGLRGATPGELITMSVMEFISAAYTPLPGASGAQEGVFSLYFGQLFPGGAKLAGLLLWRFFTYYISLLIGAIVVLTAGLREGKTLKEIRRITDEHAG